MNYIDVIDAVPFDLRSPSKDERGSVAVRLLLNYESQRWELWFDGPNGESATAVSECRTRVLLHRDGRFEVLERHVPVRKFRWTRR
jgi:hypothetical protein